MKKRNELGPGDSSIPASDRKAYVGHDGANKGKKEGSSRDKEPHWSRSTQHMEIGRHLTIFLGLWQKEIQASHTENISALFSSPAPAIFSNCSTTVNNGLSSIGTDEVVVVAVPFYTRHGLRDKIRVKVSKSQGVKVLRDQHYRYFGGDELCPSTS
jgi:hypothetical protein